MPRIRTLLLLITLGLLVACSDPAREKFETAQFEEQQFNQPHAIALYREIVAEHPESSYAAPAARRLAELTAEPPPRTD